MSLSLTNENKITLNITNEERDNDLTWDEMNNMTWDEATGTWNSPKRPLDKESKNTLTITNESKI